jgi:hypothetical protein
VLKTIATLRAHTAKNLVHRKPNLIFSLLHKPTTSLRRDIASAAATAALKSRKERVLVHSRAYQVEMLENSLKRNVIIITCLPLAHYHGNKQ